MPHFVTGFVFSTGATGASIVGPIVGGVIGGVVVLVLLVVATVIIVWRIV